MWRATLWKTRETPVDNSIAGDRSLDGGAARSPFPNGMLVRALELCPDPDPDPETHASMRRSCCSPATPSSFRAPTSAGATAPTHRA